MTEVRQEILAGEQKDFSLDMYVDNPGCSITKLGVQAPAGTNLIIDGHNIMVGRNGIWELPYGIKVKQFECHRLVQYDISYNNVYQEADEFKQALDTAGSNAIEVGNYTDTAQTIDPAEMAEARNNYLTNLNNLLLKGQEYYNKLVGLAVPKEDQVILDRIIIDYVIESDEVKEETKE